jgi:hypothetical protein
VLDINRGHDKTLGYWMLYIAGLCKVVAGVFTTRYKRLSKTPSKQFFSFAKPSQNINHSMPCIDANFVHQAGYHINAVARGQQPCGLAILA